MLLKNRHLKNDFLNLNLKVVFALFVVYLHAIN